MQPIPVAGPWITQKEIDYVTDAVTNGWYGNASDYPHRFEQAFAGYLNVQHAVALPSCTSAIHLALAAIGVGPGDEVIVPELTWIASAAPIAYVGATAVFADVDPSTWCMCATSFANAITARTKAVIPVDLYGGVPDMNAIRAVARQHRIAVIEDAAEAIGSEYRGQKAGTLGDVGVFSFHGSKTLTTGEGGMLVTNDTQLHQRVLTLRDHGRPPGDRVFWNTEVAFKYKMSALQAALGLAQLERIDELVERKREIFRWYHRRLSEIPGLTLNAEPEGTKNSYWMTTMLLDPQFGLHKEDLLNRFAECQIDARPIFYPLSSLPAFSATEQARIACKRNHVSYALSPHGINLPSALSLTENQVDLVCRVLRSIIAMRKVA